MTWTELAIIAAGFSAALVLSGLLLVNAAHGRSPDREWMALHRTQAEASVEVLCESPFLIRLRRDPAPDRSGRAGNGGPDPALPHPARGRERENKPVLL